MKSYRKVTKTNYITLPKALKEAIKALPLSKTQKSHCYKFIGILLRDSFKEYQDISEYTPKPQTYLTRTFDTKYYQWLNVLITSKVVIRTEYYSYDSKSECYNYKVNSAYFQNYNSESTDTVAYKDVIKNYLGSKDNEYTSMFESDVKQLKIDYRALEDIIDKRVASLSINDFKINEQIPNGTIKLLNSQGNEYYIGRDLALAQAKEKGFDLIQDKNIFRIQTKEAFIASKKASISLTYRNAINSLRSKSYRARINETNYRLDTNFTNMCSELVDEICRQNNLIQIDLKNSQFAILSYILQDHLDTDDFKLFKALSAKGELYEYVQKHMRLEARKDAKYMMFELLFSSRNNNTAGKKELKRLFPNVIAWIDNYKKEYGDNQFAIILQKKESELFIENIFSSIKKKKMFCFTKHDSVIVKAGDFEQSIAIIDDFFSKISFDAVLDTVIR